MPVNVQQTNASTYMQGFGYVGEPTSAPTIVVNSQTLAAGATHDESVSVAVPDAETNVATLNLVRFTGIPNSALNGKWLLLRASTSFRNVSPPNSFDVGAVVVRSGGRQTLTIRFLNPTLATQTIPNLTIDFKTVFYTAPW